MAIASYQGSANPRDRGKAIVAVALVHAGLAAVILTGLNGKVVRQAVDRLVTIDIAEPKPPPPPPPPAPRERQAPREAGAPAKKAEATPVVAPRPKLPVPSPIPATPVAGSGSSTSQGAGTGGNGTGAGGAGNGRGAGFTPARRISKIPDREYRRLAATGLQSGRVGVTIKVNSDGSVGNCRVARSSGDSAIDSLMCDLTLRYVRFDPARDPSGRAVAQDITFFPNWWRP
jgi:protein TonB